MSATHHPRVVGREDEGRPVAAVDLLHESHDRLAGDRVEVGGGLVGENDHRVGHQGSRHRHPLALPAGELVRPVMGAVGEADLGQGPSGSLAAALPRHPSRRRADEERELHVLEGGEDRDEVEGLEDEADLFRAQVGEGIVAESGHVRIADQDPARRGMVEAADQVQEGGLPGSGGTGDRDELAPLDGERDPPERGDGGPPQLVVLRGVFDPNRAHGLSPSG